MNYFCVCSIFPFYLYFRFIKRISPRNVEIPPWYGRWLLLEVQTSFKLYRKPHTFSKPFFFYSCVVKNVMFYINWRNVQRKYVVNNVDIKYVKFKGTMTKWPVQKPTHRTTQKHVEHYDVTDRKNYVFVFFGLLFFILFFIYNFLNEFSKKCWVTALVRSITFIGS